MNWNSHTSCWSLSVLLSSGFRVTFSGDVSWKDPAVAAKESPSGFVARLEKVTVGGTAARGVVIEVLSSVSESVTELSSMTAANMSMACKKKEFS